MYYIYILRCEDNSLYTGITTDWKRRIHEHYYHDKKCAKYTKSHQIKEIASLWSVTSKSSALKIEKKIKTLTKEFKEKLVQSEILLCDCTNDLCIDDEITKIKDADLNCCL